MATPEDIIAKEMRAELEARLNAYKDERARLLLAQDRIIELDQLIAFIDSEPATVKVEPRKKPVSSDIALSGSIEKVVSP